MAPSVPRTPRAKHATKGVPAADPSTPTNKRLDEPFDDLLDGEVSGDTIDKDKSIPKEGPLSPTQGERALLADLDAGKPWYPALLRVIARWVAPEEQLADEHYHYLIGGEAFDWLLLAQRLLDATGDRVPEVERETLLFFGVAPDGENEEQFEQGIGPAKHRAHLNFQYGVVVEEALLLATELELRKAGRLSRTADRDADLAAYERVYSHPLEDLRVIYRMEENVELGERVSLAELREFTYWCSKYRVQRGEPERVASDTHKALALLSQLALRSAAARTDSMRMRGPVIDETGGPDTESGGNNGPPMRPGGNGRRAPQPNRRRSAISKRSPKAR